MGAGMRRECKKLLGKALLANGRERLKNRTGSAGIRGNGNLNGMTQINNAHHLNTFFRLILHKR